MDPVVGPWKIFPVIYILCGVCFNVMSFITNVMQQFRQDNLFIYFIVIITADILALTGPLLVDWIKMTFNTDIRLQMTWTGMCPLHRWLSDVALDVPPWVLVIMAFEKRALVWFPIPADSRFSRSTVKIILLVTCLVLMIFHSTPLLVTMPSTVNVSLAHAAHSPLGPLNNSQAAEVPQLLVCDLEVEVSLVRLVLAWMNFFLRGLGPYTLLLLYTGAVVRKIVREKWCARRLMLKVGISPPPWFYQGIVEMERTVTVTGTLAVLMLLTTFPRALYDVMQQHRQDATSMFQPPFWTVSNVMFYISYVFMFPMYALYDQGMLTIMFETWQNPFVRKRGSAVASMAPRIDPDPAINTRLQLLSETRTSREAAVFR